MNWISIKDKVPEEDVDILISDGDKIAMGQYLADNPQDSDNYNIPSNVTAYAEETYFTFNLVTHWMPLPEPPKNNEK